MTRFEPPLPFWHNQKLKRVQSEPCSTTSTLSDTDATSVTSATWLQFFLVRIAGPLWQLSVVNFPFFAKSSKLWCGIKLPHTCTQTRPHTRAHTLTLFAGLLLSPLSPPSLNQVATGNVEKQDLFIPGSRKDVDIVYPCYRQPAIINASPAGSLLIAFAEGRNVSNCAPPLLAAQAPPLLDAQALPLLDTQALPQPPPPTNEVGGLVARTSSDGGLTWSRGHTIFSGNIDYYAVVYDSGTSRVWLMLQEQAAVKALHTDDAGATWSLPTLLNATVPSGAGITSSIKPAVGHGIQLQANLCANAPCKHSGRLILPFVCTASDGDTRESRDAAQPNLVCLSCRTCLLVSDDHGDTWHITAVAQPGSREAQVR